MTDLYNKIKPPKKNRSALSSLSQLLAHRDYSVWEIKQKLSSRFSSNEIELAIQQAQKYHWLIKEQELSQKIADYLSRKNKGYKYIQNYLAQKHLPPVPLNEQMEYEKASRILEQRWRKKSDLPLSPAVKLKASRFLQQRGFDFLTIKKVLYENQQ